MIKAIDKWIPGYLQSVARRPKNTERPRHLVFCVADHFEPLWNQASHARALERVKYWAERYPQTFSSFRDADGFSPRHTFFYPQEHYDEKCIEALAGLCSGGNGEIEVHIHHRNDSPEDLRAKLTDFRDRLYEQHGLLCKDRAGRIRYGFIHGNWALCNSRPDGDWCGVNEELGILGDTGCYADFTFPSAPSPTQPRMVNAIYYATDTPGKARGHDTGTLCRKSEIRNPKSETEQKRSLLLIQGPLGLNWRDRKWGIIPRLENGDMSANNLPAPDRIDLWVRQHIHVIGRPDWVFVKVHTHGCVEENMDVLFGDSMKQLHEHVQNHYNDGRNWRLHYVTARELYNIVKAAEAGEAGNPGEFRDYEIGLRDEGGNPARSGASLKPEK